MGQNVFEAKQAAVAAEMLKKMDMATKLSDVQRVGLMLALMEASVRADGLDATERQLRAWADRCRLRLLNATRGH